MNTLPKINLPILPQHGEKQLHSLEKLAKGNLMPSSFEHHLKEAGDELESAPASLGEASRQMEILFTTYMLKIMEESGTENGLLGKASQGMGYFKDLFLESVAEKVVDGKGLGFRDSLANTYGAKR